MTGIARLAAHAAAIVEPWLTIAAVLAWCLPLALLAAPAWRLAWRRGRPLDALWGVLLLGVVNRIASDFLGTAPALQHLSAIIIAALLASVVRSYQHADT